MDVLAELEKVRQTLHNGLDRNSEIYRYHLEQQRQDGQGQEPTPKYLDYLFDKILPTVDGAKDWRAAAKDWVGLDVGARLFLTWDYFKALGNTTFEGIDVGLECLEICRKAEKPCYEQDAHFLLERYKANSLDFVYSTHCLEHCIGMPIVMRNIFEALKPGGLFFLALPSPSAVGSNPHGHWYEIEGDSHIISMMRNAGFGEPLFAEHYCCFFRDADEYVGLWRKADK